MDFSASLSDSGNIFGLDLERDCYHTEDWPGFGSLVTFLWVEECVD